MHEVLLPQNDTETQESVWFALKTTPHKQQWPPNDTSIVAIVRWYLNAIHGKSRLKEVFLLVLLVRDCEWKKKLQAMMLVDMDIEPAGGRPREIIRVVPWNDTNWPQIDKTRQLKNC